MPVYIRYPSRRERIHASTDGVKGKLYHIAKYIKTLPRNHLRLYVEDGHYTFEMKVDIFDIDMTGNVYIYVEDVSEKKGDFNPEVDEPTFTHTKIADVFTSTPEEIVTKVHNYVPSVFD
jgi:hypothetical protein